MKKVLITGGQGFIARNLTEQLGNQYQIFSPDSRTLNLLDSQKVYNLLKKRRFDTVIHTATYDAAPKHSTKDPAKVLENNLKMFFNLTRGKDYFAKMIYFGSGAEFSRPHWIPKMKENYFDQHIPIDQYGFSKYIMTKYTQSNHKIYNLRLFGMFGKHDDWRTRFIANACCRAAFGLPIVINQNRRFDHLYIDDLGRIVSWFIKNNPRNRIYNVCSGQVYDFKTLAKKIINASGKTLNINIKQGKSGVEYSGNNQLLLHEIKNFKFTPIDKAIKSLYNWYVANKSLLKKTELLQE